MFGRILAVTSLLLFAAHEHVNARTIIIMQPNYPSTMVVTPMLMTPSIPVSPCGTFPGQLSGIRTMCVVNRTPQVIVSLLARRNTMFGAFAGTQNLLLHTGVLAPSQSRLVTIKDDTNGCNYNIEIDTNTGLTHTLRNVNVCTTMVLPINAF
jgi:hypothetical protein